MKWMIDDIDLYLKEKEYMDTVIVPFVPIKWGDDMTKTVVEGRFSQLLAEETERQLKGRVILSPPFSYTKDKAPEDKQNLFKDWIQEMGDGGVRHIICLVSDPDFSREKDLSDEKVHVMWFPALPIDHMDAKHKQDYLDDYVGQVMKHLTRIWGA